MKVDDIFSKTTAEPLHTIKTRCSDFLDESLGIPLLKSLPSSYKNVQKVKVRKKKSTNSQLSETFNDAFNEEWYKLRERAVFANGESSFHNTKKDQDDFYIFPIDGFQYMYSIEVQNSNQDYKTVFDAVYEEFGSEKGNNRTVEIFLHFQ